MGTYLFFLFSSSKLRCVAAIHIVLALLVDPIVNYELKKYFYSTFFSLQVIIHYLVVHLPSYNYENIVVFYKLFYSIFCIVLV